MKEVVIIGAGLAGTEAAWQLANKGIKVKLYEQKPLKKHEAFKTDLYAELICSNSLRSDDLNNGVGLLKKEMEELNSLIIEAAYANRVDAGASLAVDRVNFSKYITDKINNHENIEVIHDEVKTLDPSIPTIIASGPLTSDDLSLEIGKLCGKEYLYFYDAISPIIEKDSIDFSKAYFKSRYEDDKDDYINCPMTKEEFDIFYDNLVDAKTIGLKEMDKLVVFEGCMPFEEMARRGKKTLLFGPMKPVGLAKDNIKPFAVVQLRKDNAIDSLYNIVGFQTHLTFSEQERIIKLIPGLNKAKIFRYGQMHRNTYINSPRIINDCFEFINYPNIFVAGQISGVEGYVESAASGLYAALNMYQYINGGIRYKLNAETMIGALASYISDTHIGKLMPMKSNYGIIKTTITASKNEKRILMANRALDIIKEYKGNLNNVQNT